VDLKERISQDLKMAMKAKDETRVSTLRMIRAEIQKKEKEKAGPQVTDEVVMQLLQTMARRHQDSIEQFQRGGRNDLVEKEQSECRIIESYLPERVSPDEIRQVVGEVITETGAATPRDIGKVMGLAMRRLKETGKLVEGAEVKKIVVQSLQTSDE
jgi:uncharacterized protein YqeY